MKIEVKVPEVGESVKEAVLAQWYVKEGEPVRKGAVLFVIETDKVTLEVAAEADGVLHILVPEGETVSIGTVVAEIDTEIVPARGEGEPEKAAEEAPKEAVLEEEGLREPVEAGGEEAERKREGATAEEAVAASMAHAVEGGPPEKAGPPLPPSVRRLVAEKGIDVSRISGTGPRGRITKGDVLLYLEQAGEAHRKEEEPKGEVPAAGRAPREAARAVEKAGKGTPGISGERAGTSQPEEEVRVTRKPMSRIRLRIAERLLEARRNTAMLTTFNEIDMSAVQSIRARFKERFRERHGVSLGIMSFFIKAVTTALREIPELNAFIDGTDIVYHGDVHLGIAVAGERGLVVPVIRNADRLGFAELERAVVDFVAKVKENRLELSDLEGGTFTITNGGVFGSLLSTPILNTPQSGILGMHKIEDRPVVVDGQVVVRPMMYVALSYDHRIVDGREAVVFLRRVKECVEHPERILLEV